MRHPLLRPRWIAGHLLALTAVVAFVLFGLWQLRRHDEKVELRDRVGSALTQPAVPIDQVPDGSFVRVSVRGTFDPEVEFRVPRSRAGVSGYEVIGTLWLGSGEAVLVDRGWVGIDDVVPLPPSTLTGEGVLWPGETGPVPEQLSEFHSRIDPVAMASLHPYSLRGEYVILTTQNPPFEIDPPEVGEVSLGPHLGYAGQWFLFAAVVVVGYPLLLRRRK